jgi:hypothetical protein
MSITASNVSEHLHSYFDRDLVLSLGRTLLCSWCCLQFKMSRENTLSCGGIYFFVGWRTWKFSKEMITRNIFSTDIKKCINILSVISLRHLCIKKASTAIRYARSPITRYRNKARGDKMDEICNCMIRIEVIRKSDSRFKLKNLKRRCHWDIQLHIKG